LPGTNNLAYSAPSSTMKEKSVITLTPGGNRIKLFLVINDAIVFVNARILPYPQTLVEAGKACQEETS